MGSVYIALDDRTARKVALKVMHSEFAKNADAKTRFEQEAKIVARLNSEHIVDVRDYGFDPETGSAFLAMELLSGTDLETKIVANGNAPTLSPQARAEIVAQLFFGVRAAHQAGVVHRDLKPANIFLHSPNLEDGKFVVKILDFGIAKDTVATGNKTSAAVGTPFWMAPEQTNASSVTPASDVWSLALIAYYVFAGREFWKGARDPDVTIMTIMREMCVDPIPEASVRAAETGSAGLLPPGFDAWFSRALDREAAQRFRDAGEAWAALAPILAPLRGQSSPAISLAPGVSAPSLAASLAPKKALAETAFESAVSAPPPSPPRDESSSLARTGMQSSYTPTPSRLPTGRARLVGFVLGGLALLALPMALLRAQGTVGDRLPREQATPASTQISAADRPATPGSSETSTSPSGSTVTAVEHPSVPAQPSLAVSPTSPTVAAGAAMSAHSQNAAVEVKPSAAPASVDLGLNAEKKPKVQKKSVKKTLVFGDGRQTVL